MATWQGFLALIPELNTLLVAIVGVLIVAGLGQIRAGHVRNHRRLMLTATGLFGLFLVLYSIRLIAHGPTAFQEVNPRAPGWAYVFYLGFLMVHMALALVTVALIPVVLLRAARGQWDRHRSLATKVAPMWITSIVMGICVYFMLFQVWR